jgi:hypothetical protein
LDGVEKVTLIAVFRKWTERLAWCCTTDTEYTERSARNVSTASRANRPSLKYARDRGTPCMIHGWRKSHQSIFADMKESLRR